MRFSLTRLSLPPVVSLVRPNIRLALYYLLTPSISSQTIADYIPIKVDYEDVYDIMSFFRGTDDAGVDGEAALAERIARQGLEWSHSHWRKEDMTAYLFRLYLEYARLVSSDRHDLDFELLPSHSSA